jgi:hypothetical protein
LGQILRGAAGLVPSYGTRGRDRAALQELTRAQLFYSLLLAVISSGGPESRETSTSS